MRLLVTDFSLNHHRHTFQFNVLYFPFGFSTSLAVYFFLSYPLLSTGWDPVISGAIGSLYTADVPSIVTETLTPSERGTGKNK